MKAFTTLLLLSGACAVPQPLLQRPGRISANKGTPIPVNPAVGPAPVAVQSTEAAFDAVVPSSVAVDTGDQNVGNVLAQSEQSAENGNPRQATMAVPQGVSVTPEGWTQLDSTVTVDGLELRYRICGPASAFTTRTKINGAKGVAGQKGDYGINVLLHGDGGESFFQFPNQGVRDGLIGVAVLAPNDELKWGGGSGVNRIDGEAHAKALNDFILNELPKVLAYDKSRTFFTGVSGGSILLSGFFIPDHMQNYKNAGVLLNCGAVFPHSNIQDSASVLRNTRIHFQSTQNELAIVQQTLPFAIQLYQKAALAAGLSQDEISNMLTVDNSPTGAHCAFDGKSYNSGIQLMADNYASIMQPGGSGKVPGIGNVRKSILSNNILKWGKPGS